MTERFLRGTLTPINRRLRPTPLSLVLAALLLGFAHCQAQGECSQPPRCAAAPVDLGGDQTQAFGISGDGRVVVGFSTIVGNTTHTFRWTSGGMVDLSPLPRGMTSQAVGISTDGRTIVGIHGSSTAYNAVRWTSTGMQRIGGQFSLAQATSSDGSILVGSALVGDPLKQIYHAFRWTSPGVVGNREQDLGTRGNYGIANATSANGSVIVGMAQNKQGLYRAFRWTSADIRAGMVDLGTLGGSLAEAKGVSADGSVVVGGSHIAGDSVAHAFLWTGTGMVDLGTLGGSLAEANAVSADGSVIVGESQIPGSVESHAFRWTKTTGMQDLNSLLTKAGVDMAGITLLEATAISADGEFIIGSATFGGKTGRAFIVRFVD